MKTQLDKHLTEEEIIEESKFYPMLTSLTIYFISITGLAVLLYFVLENVEMNPFLEGQLLYNIQEESIRFLLVNLIFTIPGYFLQRKMYALYHQSIIRSAMVPVLFFNVFLSISMINLFWTREHQDESIWFIMGVWCLVNAWLLTLSLFISWYFEHQKKWLYLLCFLGHWLLISLITGIAVS